MGTKKAGYSREAPTGLIFFEFVVIEVKTVSIVCDIRDFILLESLISINLRIFFIQLHNLLSKITIRQIE